MRRSSRRAIARHAAHSSPGVLGQLLRLAGVGLAVVLVSALGVAAYSFYDLTANFADDAVELEDQRPLPPEIGAIETSFNVLMVGTDECEPELVTVIGEERCMGPDAAGQLNDVNLLVHVSVDPRRVTVISFPRDLMIPIPSCTREDGSEAAAMSKQPLNAAFAHGGLPCVAKTVARLSDQSVPFAAKVSFGNVISITGAIGGVEVCIGNDGIRDPHTRIDWPAGSRNVEGIDALQFLRTRDGVGDGSDLARIGNQQQYMSSLVRKLVSDEILSNPATLYRLAVTAADNITPSTSLTSPVRIVQLALALRDVSFDDIVFVQYPVLADPDDASRVVPDDESARILWDALAANRPLQLTGEPGANGGVVEVAPTPSPDDETLDETAQRDDEAVLLPENVSGSTAAQETCSAGNR